MNEEKARKLAELEAEAREQDAAAEEDRREHAEAVAKVIAEHDEGTSNKATVIALTMNKLYDVLDGLGILDDVDDDDMLDTMFEHGGGAVIAAIVVGDLTYGIDARTEIVTRQRERAGRQEWSKLLPDREWGPWEDHPPPRSRARDN